MSDVTERWILSLLLSAEQVSYLDSCARIRCISRAALVKRLLDAIAKDQMVISILDDDSKPGRHRYERPYDGASA